MGTRVEVSTAQALGRFSSVLPPVFPLVLAVAAVLLVAVIDFVTDPALSFTVFYLLPVLFVTWYSNRGAGLFIAAVCTLLWTMVELANAPGIKPSVVLCNAVFRFSMLAFVVLLLSRMRALQADLEKTLTRRTEQLDAETASRLAIERELASVSHREQQRIAHELHDGFGQELGALAFQAKLLASKLRQNENRFASDAEKLVSTLNASIGRARALSSLLDPLGRESGGLRPALSQLADYSGQAFGIACTFEAPPELPELPAEGQLHLYRIAQEAIHNAVQHGNATAVAVQATAQDGTLVLHINDNGSGFRAGLARSVSRDGMGLRIMRHRAAMLGGHLQIDSEPGSGCRVVCSLPVVYSGEPLLSSHHV